MAIISEEHKPDNSEAYNSRSIKSSLTDRYFLNCGPFLQSSSPDIFVLWEINLEESIDTSFFSFGS